MLDEALEVLANKHRRRLLVALLEHNPQEAVQTPEGVYLGERTLSNLQVEMHHRHLPKLEAAGYIVWQKDEHIVVRGPDFDEIEPILELFEANADELPVDWP